MSVRYFLDTNIFVCTFDPVDERKRQIALQLVDKALASGQGVISYQVVQEFFNVATRKFKTPLDQDFRGKYLDSVLVPLLVAHSSIQLFERALEMMPKLGISWFDSLIVASAA